MICVTPDMEEVLAVLNPFVGVHQLEAPTYLFIQMQLCQKESLKDWLAKNVHNRPQRVVSHYFQQVELAIHLQA